jgi:hypothetical protein
LARPFDAVRALRAADKPQKPEQNGRTQNGRKQSEPPTAVSGVNDKAQEVAAVLYSARAAERARASAAPIDGFDELNVNQAVTAAKGLTTPLTCAQCSPTRSRTSSAMASVQPRRPA